MSSCCAATPESESRECGLCPESGTKGIRVPLETVKALLTPQAMRHVTQATHRFCADLGCEVVYFAEDGRIYRTAEVRVRVWHKEPPGARMVCYCFGENEADIRAEIDTAGKSEAGARVRAHIAAGRCACEVRNPRGACCLGDVAAAVKRAAGSAAAETRTTV